jgi:endonuclease-3
MATLEDRKKLFLGIFSAAQKKYSKSLKRLAAEGWPQPWQVLISTIMSAQSRDETTIPIAENLFKKYPTLKALANANYKDILRIFKSLNYNRTKAKHVIDAAKYILETYKGKVPENIDDLIKIPGVGRKTANIVRVEVHKQHAIPVDTHVFRLSNVLGLVKTKTPEQTEQELMKIAPRKYWAKLNRIFVLWGKDIPGRDKRKLLRAINYKN